MAPELLEAVEKGSPESLREAVLALSEKKNLSESETVLLHVAKSIISLCWKSENAEGLIPELPISNPYVGALNSVRQGVYDYSTGKSDFLTLVLPSLVILSSSGKTDFLSDSEKDLEKALELKSDSVLLNYLLGFLFLKLNRNSDSEKYLLLAKEKSPSNSEIDFALSQALFRNGHYSDSDALARKLYEKNPSSRQILLHCAETSFMNGDYDACENFVTSILQIETENPYYILFRAKLYALKNDYIRAAALLDAYEKTDDSSMDYLLLRAKIQKEWNRNNSLAAQTIGKALEIYPSDLNVILLAAEIAAESSSSVCGKTAVELSEMALSIDSDNFRALEIKVMDLVRREKWSDAYKLSSQLMKNPDRTENYAFTHISVCLSAGKKDEALKLAAALYEEKPDSEEVVQSYVNALVENGKKNEASKLISSLISTDSSKLRSFLYYEKSLIDSKEEDVLSDLRNSLSANPRNKDSLLKMYRIYFGKKEYRKAQYYLKQVIVISPDDRKIRELDENLNALLLR